MATRRLASIEVQDGRGYVWDAEEALWLRQSCGIVGAMVGGVAGFKTQNAVHGLPLELSAEEVTVALEKEWAELQPGLNTAGAALATAAAQATRKRPRQYDSDSEGSAADAPPPAPATQPAPWRTALANGSHFSIPTRPETSGEGGQGGLDPGPVPAWTYPSSPKEQQRYAVYRDLLSKVFRVTGGSKFGADYLVYPGDPTLFHAQFCVRLMDYAAPIPAALLASACRGSHQARKHLLIASQLPSGAVTYTTIGPVDGFG